jgi:hypothetical protein
VQGGQLQEASRLLRGRLRHGCECATGIRTYEAGNEERAAEEASALMSHATPMTHATPTVSEAVKVGEAVREAADQMAMHTS